jgi:RecA-family ATPase
MNQESKCELINLIENDQSIKVNKALEIKSANEWIEESMKTPIPKKLFDSFWFEGELCILYSDSNLGKSILAVQIGDSISTGKPIPGFELTVQPQKVLYLDCELSAKQFEKRYSNEYKEHYLWHPNFLRAEIKQDVDIDGKKTTLEEEIITSVKQGIIDFGFDVVIIDNITFLNSDNEKGSKALELMKKLKSIKTELGISMLVLAHTPKRNQYAPLTKNDLSGSRQIMNFVDSAVAIGESATENGLRYIKQIKQRNTECIYHSQNVVVCEIASVHSFLGFHLLKYDDELSHLKQPDADSLELRDEQISDLKSQGLNNSEIGRQLSISEGTVRNRLNKMQD